MVLSKGSVTVLDEIVQIQEEPGLSLSSTGSKATAAAAAVVFTHRSVHRSLELLQLMAWLLWDVRFWRARSRWRILRVVYRPS